MASAHGAAPGEPDDQAAVQNRTPRRSRAAGADRAADRRRLELERSGRASGLPDSSVFSFRDFILISEEVLPLEIRGSASVI